MINVMEALVLPNTRLNLWAEQVSNCQGLPPSSLPALKRPRTSSLEPKMSSCPYTLALTAVWMRCKTYQAWPRGQLLYPGSGKGTNWPTHIPNMPRHTLNVWKLAMFHLNQIRELGSTLLHGDGVLSLYCYNDDHPIKVLLCSRMHMLGILVFYLGRVLPSYFLNPSC